VRLLSDETAGDADAGRRARNAALRLASIYASSAALWIVLSDRVLATLGLSAELAGAVNTGKGLLFVTATTAVLYLTSGRFLRAAYRDQERYRRAQEELHDREQSIRQAYIDVLDAVTGGRLILMWPEDLPASLGEVVLPTTSILRPEELAETRHRLAAVLGPLTHRVSEAVLAANEGLANALKHGGQGEYSVRRTSGSVQIEVTDFGPGIDFHTLPRATLIPGFSTKPSLGMGFTIMLEVADRLLLATEPGLTTLVLEFELDRKPADRSECDRGAVTRGL